MMTFICWAEGELLLKQKSQQIFVWAKFDEIKKMIEDFSETIFSTDILPLKKYIRLEN